MKPLYSIIIPTFNSEGTIHECLASLMTQTFTSFEILIMDGVSSDHTIDIAKSFDDNRIRINSEKDIGIYDAMNKGIDMAKGEWLYFLGGDDILYDSNVLNEIKLNLSDCDVVYGNVISTRFNGVYDGEFDDSKIRSKNICHQSIFFKRSVFKKTGLFDLRFKSHADWDHNMKWFLSENIRKKFLNIIIANYADGGFSSITGDKPFSCIKNWKYYNLTKKKISFVEKLKIIKREVIKASLQKDYKNLIAILIQIPQFLL